MEIFNISGVQGFESFTVSLQALIVLLCEALPEGGPMSPV